MTTRPIEEAGHGAECGDRHIQGLSHDANPAPIQAISSASPGQSYPEHYPQRHEPDSGPLGPPLSIRDVAAMLGCSEWTVRQKYMVQGIPYLRSGLNGKLVFFSNQVVEWILNQQRPGRQRNQGKGGR